MNKKYIFRTTFAFVGIIGLIFTSSVAYGQTSSCLDLKSTVSPGLNDARTKGEVTKVQNFLYTQKYLAVSPTGYFGALSQSALRKFQSSNNISTTGTVGPLTRAKIKEISCASTDTRSTTKSMTIVAGSQNIKASTSSTEVLRIVSITPDKGKGEETITIIGSGFTSDTVVNYRRSTSTNSGSGQIGNQKITLVSPNELRFVLDSRHVLNSYAGNQFFYLSNSKGVSNFINFTFTEGIDTSITSTIPISTPTNTSGVVFWRNLEMGAAGTEVVELQKYLQSKGLLKMPVGVMMGSYDALTKTALMAYQVSVGISPADGVLGPLTRAKLNADISSSSVVTNVVPPGSITNSNITGNNLSLPKNPTFNSTMNMDIGTKGADVVTLQSFLEQKDMLTIQSGVAKGTYDQNTKNAVVKYQNSKGIFPANGVVEAVTRASIISEISSGNIIPFPTTVLPVSTILPTISVASPVLNLSATKETFWTTGRIFIDSYFIPRQDNSQAVSIRATCPPGVTVYQGTDVCNGSVTMSYNTGPGAYRETFQFSNTTGVSQQVIFNGTSGQYSASASVWVLPADFTVKVYPTSAKIDLVTYDGKLYRTSETQSITVSTNKPISFTGGFEVGSSKTDSAISTTWIYGDGTNDVENQSPTTTSGGAGKKHVYANPGTYAVHLVFKTTGTTATSSPFTVIVN